MRIVISNQSGKPIYEQIEDQIKTAILSGQLKVNEQLPSIRSLAKDLRISVITTTRTYHELEAAGFITNVQGKGAYVLGQDSALVKENALREIETYLNQAIDTAKIARIAPEELHTMLDTLMHTEGDTDNDN
ncbi:GntR family transcriptional regulator [Lacticaseibacillus paracasei]|uniref:GntR family transcriptional regulator n=1 Tax=Lacticaseibacillus paracasei TaxID=1597 RepID=UPI0022EC70F3|nr:GntR family transcriptional regulator [Lacticaseibacillus paracasei]WBS98686.1 GntR family transcriptional regulator [Lacticaseibacillus paracasei]